MTFNLCCGIDEIKLALMVHSDEGIPSDIDYPLAKYFFENERRDWSIKGYVPSCELCDGTERDRMQRKEDIDYMVRDLRVDDNLDNKSKCCAM